MCAWSCLGTQIKQLGLLGNVHSLPIALMKKANWLVDLPRNAPVKASLPVLIVQLGKARVFEVGLGHPIVIALYVYVHSVACWLP